MRSSCRITLLAALFVAATAAEPGNRPPLDESRYLEVPTWFSVFPGYLTRHLAPAAVVTAIADGSPASAAGLAIGDRLIALDGRRVHDAREIRLLRSAMSSRHDQESWTIERGQECLTLTVAGLDPFRSTGATLIAPGDVPDCVALLAPLGISMPTADAEALRWLPGRVSHAFADWLASSSGTGSVQEAPWIGEWVATYLHVLRGEAVAQATAAIPEPFLGKLDRLHRAIAANRAAGEPSCALDELGCDAWFCALFYPYPAGTAPAFGTPTLSPPVAAVLRLLYEDPLGSWPQRHFAATHLPMQPNALGRFIHDISCALIEFPSWYEARLYMPRSLNRGVHDWDPAQRAGMLAELERRFAAQVDDADVAGVALCVALASAGRCGDATQVTATLAARSPYLAWRARELAMFLVRRHGTPKDLAILATDAQRNPHAGPAPCPEIYEKTIFACPTLAYLAGGCDADPRHGLPALFRARPELVASGLERHARSDRDRWTIYDSCDRQINATAWRIASRQPYADAEQALQCAHMILAMTQGGAWLDLNTKDTVAACLARGGDFANAVRIQQEAIAQLPPLWPVQLADFGKRLALYQAHQVADEPRAADEPVGELVEARLAWPGGQRRAVGHTCAGARIGPWRFFSATGALEATCSYWAGVVDGPARSYHPDGTVQTEGFFANWGERIGRWRSWHPGGMLASDGTYVLNGRTPQKCGEWQWFDSSGLCLESGRFSYDQRVGPWSAWDLAGRLICRATFVSGTPQPAVDWPRTHALTEPASPEPVPATAEEFVARGAARHRVYEMVGTLADFTRAIELAPDLASAWAGRARARVDRSDHAGALGDADRAIALGAADATVHRIRAAALAGSGDHAGAERDYTRAITLAPADRDAHFGRGRSRDGGGDHAGAIADFTTVLGLKPDDQEALFCRGLARQAAGQAAAAISDFSAYIAKDPGTVLAYYHLAELKAGTGDRVGAIAALDALIARAPWNNEAFLKRGYLKQDGGAMDDALNDFTHTIGLQPSHIIGYPARGALLCDLGRLAEALADYRKIPDVLSPGSGFKESTHLRIWLIRTLLGEGAAAVEELQQYLAARQPAAAPDWMLAVMRFVVGQLSEADLLATVPGQETARDSESACVAHYYIGAKHLIAGEQDVAINHFKTCIASGRRDINEIRSAEAELARLAQLRK